MLRVLSLGAGVQSTALALMAAHGEITPMPDCAIFADTQSEPKSIYAHLDWLDAQLPFVIHRVSAGSLRAQIIASTKGEQLMNARPPFFVAGGGMLNRQCTQDFKLQPIQRKLRELLGLRRGQHWPSEIAVEQWLGISLDEAMRIKPSRIAAISHRYPLVDAGLTRGHCLRWMDAHNYPRPAKSACTFCPYHDDGLWRDMKANDPESFADAVTIDVAIRKGSINKQGERYSPNDWFLHRSLKPLADVDFRNAEDYGQLSMFTNECEGMCGV